MRPTSACWRTPNYRRSRWLPVTPFTTSATRLRDSSLPATINGRAKPNKRREIMRRSTYLSILGASAVLGGVAAPALAATCADAQFSQAVLDRFPNIRLVCSEIIEKEGQ